MTGRGPISYRLPPKDPSLQTRPVPRARQFPVRSVGPGANSDIRQTVRSVQDIDALTGFHPGPRFPPNDATPDELERFNALREVSLWRMEMRRFLACIDDEIDYENGEPFDPTWGFCIFLTSYAEEALQKLDTALSTLLEAVRRYFLCYIDPHSQSYVHEVLKRFKLDMVMDRDVLQNASDDRVREEFNAHVGHLHFWPLGEEEYPQASGDERVENRPPAAFSRFDFVIALDEAKIVELSNLEFGAVDEDEHKLQDVTVKVIDRQWDYSESPNNEYGHCVVDGVRKYYDGTDLCPIWKLALIYEDLQLPFLRGDLGKMLPMAGHEKIFS